VPLYIAIQYFPGGYHCLYCECRLGPTHKELFRCMIAQCRLNFTSCSAIVMVQHYQLHHNIPSGASVNYIRMVPRQEMEEITSPTLTSSASQSPTATHSSPTIQSSPATQSPTRGQSEHHDYCVVCTVSAISLISQ